MCRSNVSLVLMFLWAFSSAGKDLFVFKGDAGLFGGYISNIYREPDIMYEAPSQGGAQFNPVDNDLQLGGELGLKSIFNINKKNRLSLSLDGDYTLLPSHSIANVGQMGAQLDYRLSLSKKLRAKIQADCGYAKNRLFDDTYEGDSTPRHYWQFGVTPELEFSPSRNFSVDASYQFNTKDYRSLPADTSLDNTSHEVRGGMTVGFGGHGKRVTNEITVDGSWLTKNYHELQAYYSTGTQDSACPFRKYHYLTAEVTYEHFWGPVSWEIAYRPRYRQDTFEDFYSYFENRIKSRVSADLKSKTSAFIDGAWRHRSYTVHEAEQPGTGDNPNLVMTYINVSAGLSQGIGKQVSLFAEYDLYSRETNTRVLYFRIYRNYVEHVAKAGVRVKW